MWGTGRERRNEAARAASAAAAATFFALDAEQRSVASAVELLAGMLGQAEGRPIREQHARLAAHCNAAIDGYLSLTQRYDLTGDSPPHARQEYERANHALAQARAELNRYAEWLTHRLGQAEAALSGLADRATAARTAIADARAATAAAEQSGVRPHRAAEQLARAEEAYARVGEGAAVHTIEGVFGHAAQAQAAATEARRLADEALGLRDRVSRALASIRTRVEALRHRAGEQAEAHLSALRREFAVGCWNDLSANPAEAEAAIAEAEREAGEASPLVRRGEVEAAWDAIQRARGALDLATARLDAIGARLEELRAVRADPKAEAERVRFAIRDAQRFLTGLPEGVTSPYASALDSRSVWLRQAEARLGGAGAHPNYWAYLGELRQIRDRVAEDVARIRADLADRAKGHWR